MKNSFYSEEELKELGFTKIGKNALISRNCSIYSNNIEIGDNVRIDDFCILTGNIKIGDYVHIAAGVYLYGKYGIEIGNFCGISARGIVYSASDDYSGDFLIGPTIPEEYLNIISGKVVLEDYSTLGASTIVMPNVHIGEGSITGTYSLVRNDLDPWGMYVGIPCKRVKERSKKLLTHVEAINGR